MAKRHVIEYYKKMELQYNEMLKDVKEYEQAFKDGYITEEQFNANISFIETIKNNYTRISYIIYLLNLPNKKCKESKCKNKKLEKYCNDQNSTMEQVLLESKDALKQFKESIPTNKE